MLQPKKNKFTTRLTVTFCQSLKMKEFTAKIVFNDTATRCSQWTSAKC